MLNEATLHGRIVFPRTPESNKLILHKPENPEVPLKHVESSSYSFVAEAALAESLCPACCIELGFEEKGSKRPAVGQQLVDGCQLLDHVNLELVLDDVRPNP